VTRFSPRATSPVVVVLALGCFSACYRGPHHGEDAGNTSDGDAPDERCADDPLPPLPNLVRLTHRQYDNTIRDLLGIDDDPSAVFLPDPRIAGFDNNAELLIVGDRLARDYRRAAEDIAAKAVTEHLADVLPCDPGDDGCADDFIEGFGRRAFRRPLTDDERGRYRALFTAADGAYDDGTAFEQGVRLVLETMLQSPNVLYRVELSSPDGDEPTVPLTGHEVATRLSYLLWNSTPDDALLDAADEGELDTGKGIAEHARRLLADERARDPVADFHAQWLQTAEYLDLKKDATLFPDWDPAVGDALQEENRRFIERVVFELEGDYDDLVTSPSSVVDARLAAIYGVDAPADWDAVDLDPGQRAGLLTQIGFLARGAYADMTSPIHRGVFVQRQLLCTTLPDPPPNIDRTLPPFEGEIHTTRDAVTALTSPDACHACHGIINEPGFALEGYDPIGHVRDEDNGWPVDAKVTMSIDGADVEIDGGVALAHAIAQSQAGPRCYVLQWFRYASMRKDTADDTCTIDALRDDMVDPDAPLSVQDLLVALTQTRTFRNRAGAP
jgi:uncharacterized protein DUF1592/uncharacterized protein DUF1588/uncharacterized protein DUF1595/uncharacterized protein DUF1587/uncharacterized protein DUF1585